MGMPEPPQVPQAPPQQNDAAMKLGKAIGEGLKKKIAEAKAKQDAQAAQTAQAPPQIPQAIQLTPEQVEEFKKQGLMQGAQGPIQPGQQQQQLAKPDKQHLDAGVIHWEWKINDLLSVFANYYQEADTDYGHDWQPGDYSVDLTFSDEPGSVMTLKTDEVEKLGLALLSSVKWEQDWQHFVGEFLAVKRPEPVAEPLEARPPELFVEDDAQVAPAKKPVKKAAPKKMQGRKIIDTNGTEIV